ncbi:uncharacterized protein H6S33_000270 [Morchella sextelata]|uniref:uncharacterized protein n=1 Tax=Morchella sextelata TaxID=1174677 RepID=UPI001D037706|nr:uncharacterized protein H6S33_000270 [Morchella sextelata]KAH0614634.1 hypothetical protein H6S33_000270 [Morchella sextelata]
MTECTTSENSGPPEGVIAGFQTPGGVAINRSWLLMKYLTAKTTIPIPRSPTAPNKINLLHFTMAPTLVTLVRHGQAAHNVDFQHHLHDTYLTPLGESQCQSLPSRFPAEPPVTLLVSSPLKRTLQTTLIGFAPQVQSGVKIEVVPEFQEASALPCDTGSPREVLEKEEAFKGLDFSRLGDDWDSKKGKWAPEPEPLRARAKEARNYLKSLDTSHVVAVLHGAFLHYLTEDWAGDGSFPGTGWSNTEFRSYTFKDEEGDNATLVETKESHERRTEHPLGNTEMKEFEEVGGKKN